MDTKLKKGFTLIELLIVIGILAVLATVTVLVLNPAELFRQARDSQRLADLGAVRGALGLYVTTVSSPDIESGTFACGSDWGASVAGASTTYAVATRPTANLKNAGVFSTSGAGWVPVDFSTMPGGSPLSVLPRDPRNSAADSLYYTYACDSSQPTFVLKTNMESSRYATGGSDDVESTDGGVDNAWYEAGTDPGLDL